MTDIENKRQLIVSLRKDNANRAETSSPPTWLISFTDVIALMLTFFVLLYAMSSPVEETFEKKVGITTQNKAEYAGVGKNAGNDEGLNINRLDFNLAEDLQYIEALFNKIILEKGLEDRIQIEGRGNLLLLYLHPTMQIGNRDFLLFINNLEPILESLDNRIEIVGGHSAMGVFDNLQALGRILQTYGYRNAVSITVRDLSSSNMNSRMAIAFRSNDGRRIVRE